MSIGTGVVLFIIGAVLAFATNFQVQGLDLRTIGYIFMAGGVVVFGVGLAFLFRRRQSVAATSVDPTTGSRVTKTSSTNDDPIL
jgi:membrane-bound ClpP family serine protease